MLAIADTAVLYVSAFKTWLRIISGYELSHINAFSCKLTMLALDKLHIVLAFKGNHTAKKRSMVTATINHAENSILKCTRNIVNLQLNALI
jgi:hypothetical protein